MLSSLVALSVSCQPLGVMALGSFAAHTSPAGGNASLPHFLGRRTRSTTERGGGGVMRGGQGGSGVMRGGQGGSGAGGSVGLGCGGAAGVCVRACAWASGVCASAAELLGCQCVLVCVHLPRGLQGL